MEPTGAAAVIIGNEVLTAKVVDANGPHLIRRLREVGIPLRSVELVPDEVDVIVEAVSRARLRAKYVFTSGGIGPTHDDVTVRAVALAMGRKVVRLPEMVELIREKAADELTAEALRLADAPEGAVLIPLPGSWFPVLTVEDVFLLPGVPQLFRMQLEVVLARLRGTPVHLRMLFLADDRRHWWPRDSRADAPLACGLRTARRWGTDAWSVTCEACLAAIERAQAPALAPGRDREAGLPGRGGARTAERERDAVRTEATAARRELDDVKTAPASQSLRLAHREDEP